MEKQLHAGTNPQGEKIWHTNPDGTYWSAWMPKDVSPKNLFLHAVSIMVDVVGNHPDEVGDLFEAFIFADGGKQNVDNDNKESAS